MITVAAVRRMGRSSCRVKSAILVMTWLLLLQSVTRLLTATLLMLVECWVRVVSSLLGGLRLRSVLVLQVGMTAARRTVMGVGAQAESIELAFKSSRG